MHIEMTARSAFSIRSDCGPIRAKQASEVVVFFEVYDEGVMAGVGRFCFPFPVLSERKDEG